MDKCVNEMSASDGISTILSWLGWILLISNFALLCFAAGTFYPYNS
jgi:hypothetical protein